MRNTGAALHQDELAHRAGAVWQRQQLPEGLADEALQLTTETLLLASRIRDDEVRALADRFRTEASKVGFGASSDEAHKSIMTASETQGLLLKRIGLLVREIDEAE